MKLQNINVADSRYSATNVKGRGELKSFDDLVASIREKGILQPVLAREIEPGIYEIIAGNRRLKAAKELKLEVIPAQIVKMDDIEAREAQIVENLQREDIHPLDEGELYRKLMEEKKGASIFNIAAKVGKKESYVKQRLFMTNLITPAADAYRAEKINDGHAVLIAKLSTGDQTKALKATVDRYNHLTVKELKEWIQENVYNQLDNQPWLNPNMGGGGGRQAEILEAVGPCVECEPDKASLFGPVKDGACTSLKCWARKMGNYIDYLAKTEHRTKVSNEYGEAPKGILSRGNYVLVGIKSKDRCESAHGAVVAIGADLGRTFDICSDKNCKTHRSSQTEYRRSPEEEAKAKLERKKDREKAVKAKEDREDRLKKALAKIKWPLSGKHLEALLALSMDQSSSLIWGKVAKRHELEVKKEKTEWGSVNYNYEGAVKKFAEGLDKTGKARLAFELLIDTGYDTLRSGIGKI